MAPRETENNTYAKFWGDKKRALWYVMVFSGVVNCFWVRYWGRAGQLLANFVPSLVTIPEFFAKISSAPFSFVSKEANCFTFLRRQFSYFVFAKTG